MLTRLIGYQEDLQLKGVSTIGFQLNYWNIRDFPNSTVLYLISLKTLDQAIRIPANAVTLNQLSVPCFQFFLW